MPYTKTTYDSSNITPANLNHGETQYDAAMGDAVAKGSLVYNVRDFGAVGDRTTDDSAAINLEIDKESDNALSYSAETRQHAEQELPDDIRTFTDEVGAGSGLDPLGYLDVQHGDLNQAQLMTGSVNASFRTISRTENTAVVQVTVDNATTLESATGFGKYGHIATSPRSGPFSPVYQIITYNQTIHLK